MVDAAIGGAFSVLIEVAKCLTVPVRNQINHVLNYKTNFESLEQQVNKLKEEKAYVDNRVREATSDGEEIERKVQSWLTSVDKIIIEADEFITEAGKTIDDEEKAKSLCFKGLCRPNWKIRYQFSKNADKKVKAIAGLREEGKFDKVSFRTIPQEIWHPNGYIDFQSRKETLTEIRKALRDPNVTMVGVYGMGGTGKTTLVREIASQVQKEKFFDKVVFAEVSQTPKTEKIQQEIAEKLGLQFHEKSKSVRASRLSEQLSNVSKILVILDNLWTDLDLRTIGIPLGDGNKGCKVLLTARSSDLLTSKMNCAINFPVGVLDQEEAWNLFKKMAGDCIENRDIQPIAKDVTEECGGLPIAIVAVASALRNKRTYDWNSALQELRRPSERNFEGIQKEAYSCIELSYNHLEDEDLKSIFLLCSLMGDHYNSKVWLMYRSMGLGLLRGTNTVEEARDRLFSLVNKLEASCLLLESRTNDQFFSMHDVVRDVALSIGCRDKHVFMVSDENVSLKWPSKGAQKNCTAINISNSNICELKEGLECPQLELFRFISQHSFVKIHENFFEGMTELKVLEFSMVGLLSLPSSIHLQLLNLRTLILHNCMLGDTTIVGELRQLETLVLYQCDIEQLPKEISQLSGLRLFSLGNCYKLKVIPRDVISSFSQLEKLDMENTYIQWDEEQPNTDRRHASLHELKHLSRLTELEIHIKDAKILPKGLLPEKLKWYKIYIGDEWEWPEIDDGRNTLKVKFNTNTICIEDIMQLKGIEVLYLDEVHSIKNVLYEVDKKGFPELKELHVQNNPYFLYIVDLVEWLPREAFPQLESLFLSNLINLEKICHGQLTADSFCKLNSIKVENCEKLKNIFSFSIVKSLPQLQTIEVIECKALEEIFAFVREDDVNNNEVVGNIELGHIRFLTLKSLPQLTTFYSEVKIDSSSQKSVLKDNEVILEDERDTPATLFNKMVVLPNLEALEVYAINCGKIWHSQFSAKSSCFQNLATLIVQGCGNLKFLFSSSIVRSFLHLQHLEVCKCSALKEIIAIEELGQEDRKKTVFPQLNFVKIEDLENLTRFSSEDYIELSSLKQLQIKQCPKFKAFVLEKNTNLTIGKEVETMLSTMEIQSLFNEIVAFPNLEEMVISHLDDLKMMWHNKKLAHNSFGKLKSIKVEGCDKLLTLCPSNMLNRFSSLESLTISDCSSLKDIFEAQELSFEETHFIPDFKLKLVSVSYCQSLEYIFQASTAKGLLQLEQLDIRCCGVLAEIVTMGQGAETSTVSFVFPKVTSLTLIHLPKLTTFYPGVHIAEWPILECLTMSYCEKVMVFVSEVVGFHKTNDKDQVDVLTQQPFFLVEKIFPKLAVLQINMKDIMMICHSNFPRHLFSKLETLRIGNNEAVVFPLGLLEIFSNLRTLVLFSSSYEELFSRQEAEKHALSLVRIRNLHLERLTNLKHMWKQDSKLNSILQNLETLTIRDCDNLIKSLPFSASLENLTALKVCYCKKMTNLITSSTAKSLKQLKKMKVKGCKMMTEIVVNKGDEAEDEITFNKLEYLSLVGLESLTCFYSGNHTFKFPSLETLIMEGCPKMEIFCRGALCTARLQYIWLKQEQYKRFWEYDLNITIQQLHKKMETPGETLQMASLTSEADSMEENDVGGGAGDESGSEEAKPELRMPLR